MKQRFVRIFYSSISLPWLQEMKLIGVMNVAEAQSLWVALSLVNKAMCETAAKQTPQTTGYDPGAQGPTRVNQGHVINEQLPPRLRLNTEQALKCDRRQRGTKWFETAKERRQNGLGECGILR